MFTQLFNRRLQIEREARLLSFAGEVKLDTSNIDPNAAAKLAENGETKDAKEQLTPEQVQKQRVEEAVKAANDTIARHNDFAAKLSPDMQKAMRTELGSFMATTIESHDRNGVAGLNKAEFDAYKANAEKEIDALFVTMGSQAAEAQKNAEKESEDASKKAAVSAGEGELKGKTLEQIEAELTGKALDSVDALAAIEMSSEKPAELQAQLAVYQQNVQKVNEAQNKIQERGALVAAFHGKATEQMKQMSDAANAVGASGAVASGAAIGAAIGVWGFGAGALVGAGIGAVGGAIVYGIGRGAFAAAQHAEKLKIATRVNSLMNSERASLNAARGKVAGEGNALAKQGTQVNAAPEALRVKTDAKTAVETQQVADLSARTAEEQASTSEQVSKINSAIERSGETEEQMKQKAEEAARSGNPEAVEAAEQIRTKAEELAAQRASMDEARGALSAKLSDFDKFLGELASTDKAIREKAEGDHDRLDRLDADLGGDVLVANVRTLQAQEGLNQEGKQLASLQTVTPEAFLSSTTWSSGFDGFAAGTKWLLKDTIVPALDWASARLKEVPVVGGLVGYSLDVVSGLAEGVSDMGEGIATMLGHPVQTATGLAKALSTAEGWWEMGKGIISYEDFANGRIGKGIGKLGLNILTTATGAGAALNGAKAASLAFIASNAAGRGILRATAIAAWTGTKVTAAEFGAGIAKMPGDFISTAGKTLSTIRTIGSGKLASLTRTVVSLRDDVAKSTAALSQFDDIKALLGDNADVVAKMGGKELAAAGLSDSKSIARFMRYRAALNKNVSIMRAHKTAETAQTLENAAPGLSGLQDLEATLAQQKAALKNMKKAKKGSSAIAAQERAIEKTLDGMHALVEKSNTAAKATAGGIGDLVHVADGYVLGVGMSGKLEILTKPADLTRWIDDTAKFAGIAPDTLRLEVAEKILGRPLKRGEGKAILDAHKVKGFGTLEDGGITPTNIKDKLRPTNGDVTKNGNAKRVKALASKDAKKLMRRGVMGEPEISVARPKERISRWDSDVDYSEVEYRDGQEIEVFYMKNGDTVEQVLDDAAKRPTMTFQDDFDDLDLDLDESSFARQPVTADDLGDGLDDAVGGAPDSVASFDPDRLPPAKKTTQQPPVLEYVDDVDEMPSSVVRLDDVDNILDDVAERTDGAGSSVAMSADATVPEDVISRLQLEQGKRYHLSKDGAGWTLESVDPDGKLVFRNDAGTLKRINPAKLTRDLTNKPYSGPRRVASTPAPARVAPVVPAQKPLMFRIGQRMRQYLDQGKGVDALGDAVHDFRGEIGRGAQSVGREMWKDVKTRVRESAHMTEILFLRGRKAAREYMMRRSQRPSLPLNDRYVAALEARKGQWFPRAKASIDARLGRDQLSAAQSSVTKARAMMRDIDKEMVALQAKIDASTTPLVKDVWQKEYDAFAARRAQVVDDIRESRVKISPAAANARNAKNTRAAAAKSAPKPGAAPQPTPAAQPSVAPAAAPVAPAATPSLWNAGDAISGNEVSMISNRLIRADQKFVVRGPKPGEPNIVVLEMQNPPKGVNPIVEVNVDDLNAITNPNPAPVPTPVPAPSPAPVPTPASAPAAPNIAPAVIDSLWKRGEVIMGREIRALDGRTIPATEDLVVLGPNSGDPNVIQLAIKNPKKGVTRLVEARVEDINAIPKPKAPPAPGSKPAVKPAPTPTASKPASAPTPAPAAAKNAPAAAPIVENKPVTRQEYLTVGHILKPDGTPAFDDALGVQFFGMSEKNPQRAFVQILGGKRAGEFAEVSLDIMARAKRMTNAPAPLTSVTTLSPSIRYEYSRYMQNPNSRYGRFTNVRTKGYWSWKTFEFDHIDGTTRSFTRDQVANVLDDAPRDEYWMIEDILQRNKKLSLADRNTLIKRRAELEPYRY